MPKAIKKTYLDVFQLKIISVRLMVTLILFSACFTLNSCTKDPNFGSEVSYIRLFSASPSVTQFYLYSNNQQVSESYFSYGAQTKYYPVFGNKSIISVSANKKGNKLIEREVTLAPGITYSVFFTGSNSDLELLNFSDYVNAPVNGQANLRLINVNSSKAKVNWFANDNTILSEQAFGTQDIISVPPGNYRLTLAMENGIKSSPTYATFSANKNYLIYTTGGKDMNEPFSFRAVVVE